MKFRAILLIIGGLVGLCVLALAVGGILIHVDGKRELAKVRNDILSEGGRLETNEFNLPPGGDIGDGFKRFSELVKSCKDLKEEIGALKYPDMRVGTFLPLSASIPKDFGYDESTSWSDLQGAHQSLRRAWEEAYQYGLAHDIHYIPDYHSGPCAEVAHMTTALEWSKIGNLLALLEIQRNELDQACQYLEQSVDIYQKLDPGPKHTLVQGLVQITSGEILLKSSRMLMASQNLQTQQLDRIPKLFDKQSPLLMLAENLEGERVFFSNWVWNASRNQDILRSVIFMSPTMDPEHDPPVMQLARILTTCIYRPFLSDQDQAFYMKYLWNVEHYARKASDSQYSYSMVVDLNRESAALAAFFEEASLFEKLQKVISSLALPALDGITRKFAWSDCSHRQLRIAVALERYHLEHGRYPEDLNALGDVSAQDLIDPVNHEPMLYRRDEERGYVLYSRGENGVDDGGAIVPPRKDGSGYRDDTAPDWVWPRPIKK